MSLASRLDTLRRQAGVRVDDAREARVVHPRAVPVAPAMQCESLVVAHSGNASEGVCRTGDGHVDDLHRRVALLRGLLTRRDGAARASRTHAPLATGCAAADRKLPGCEIAPGLQLIESTHAHDAWPDSIELDPVRSPLQRKLASDPLANQPSYSDCASLLAFDTETTGLAGGTGTRAFMIGAAHLHEGRIHVRQLLATTLGGEAAMLRTFAGWIDPQTVLVSYNGRSYDRPLLSTRFRLARMVDPLLELQHMDLLHVTRRCYRGVWANCRLATAERELLGVLRTDDLPGSEAPAAWRDWLRGGPAEPLRRVALHNRQDLLSLFGLLRHFVLADQARESDIGTLCDAAGIPSPRANANRPVLSPVEGVARSAG